jgi:hypothetical protein
MDRYRCALVAVLIAATVGTQASAGPVTDESTATSQAAEKPETVAAADAAAAEEFKPPPGYRQKKFGDKILYCIKDTTVGTRFKTEKCYDETQMKDVILAREQNNRDFDRARAICSNPAICAPE